MKLRHIAFIIFYAQVVYAQVDRGLGVHVAPSPTAIIDAHCYELDGEARCADKVVSAPRWNKIHHGSFPQIGTPGTPVKLVPATPTVGPTTPTPVKSSWCVCCARAPQPNQSKVLISIGPASWGDPGFYLDDGECVTVSAPATNDCADLYVITQNPGDTARCDMQ